VLESSLLTIIHRTAIQGTKGDKVVSKWKE